MIYGPLIIELFIVPAAIVFASVQVTRKRGGNTLFFGMSNSGSKSKKISGAQINLTGNDRTVLIVDDDPLIRRIHKALLNKFGFETHVVANGKEAVDLYRSGNCFDLVLMDMEMPFMDGPKATRELRAMGVSSKIVGVTSRELEWEKQAFIGAGLDQCHEKPLTADTVTSLLQGLINGK